jgi:pyruvate,water dikinase
VVREAIEGAARSRRVLDDDQVQALAALGTRVESHYGAPQDIEWALAEGRFFLLQTRPITSLFPVPAPQPTDDGLHVYFSLSHAQVMTDPMPPFARSVWRLVFPFGKPGPTESENPYITTAAGRLYLDMTPLLLMPRVGKLFPRLLRVMADALSGAALQEVQARPEFWQNAEARRARFGNVARWLVPLYARALARLLLLPPERAAGHLNAYSNTYVARAGRRLAAAAPGAPRLRAARRLLATSLATVIVKMAPYLAAGIQARMLLGLFGRRLGLPDAADMIVRGLNGNVTMEMDLAVGDLADFARRSPALVEHLRRHDAKAALATAAEVPGGAEFLDAWQQFLDKYGMRGPSEIDFSRPGWVEEPASLMQVIVANLEVAEPGSHRAKQAELASARRPPGTGGAVAAGRARAPEVPVDPAARADTPCCAGGRRDDPGPRPD